MLFNSIEFALFLPIVFLLYWGIPPKFRNAWVIAASYFFYGYWDWRFLSLIAFSTLVDFVVALRIAAHDGEKQRRALLLISLAVNLGLLGFFKYQGFFVESFVDAFSFFGQPLDIAPLKLILPVGVSFYTFQTLSYTIDVYRRKLEPTRDFLAFAAFVSFFPQLVAGPIERASHLLPQFYSPRTFEANNAVDGMRQMLWGLAKKVIIADNAAVLVGEAFNAPQTHPASTLALGLFCFAMQIYGDFSGYSDIAIGSSRLFGVELNANFAFPYFSRDIAEFWRRWHISLSSWFRDYVYIPLGGNRAGAMYTVRNVFAIFLLSGLWHGANWTFVAWGFIHALLFVPLMLGGRHRRNTQAISAGRHLPSLAEGLHILATFLLVCIGWAFFRADSLSHAFVYLRGLVSPSLLSTPDFTEPEHLRTTLICIGLFLGLEWFGRHGAHGLSRLMQISPRWARHCIYYLLITAIVLLRGEEQDFIYFQF